MARQGQRTKTAVFNDPARLCITLETWCPKVHRASSRCFRLVHLHVIDQRQIQTPPRFRRLRSGTSVAEHACSPTVSDRGTTLTDDEGCVESELEAVAFAFRDHGRFRNTGVSLRNLGGLELCHRSSSKTSWQSLMAKKTPLVRARTSTVASRPRMVGHRASHVNMSAISTQVTIGLRRWLFEKRRRWWKLDALRFHQSSTRGQQSKESG